MTGVQGHPRFSEMIVQMYKIVVTELYLTDKRIPIFKRTILKPILAIEISIKYEKKFAKKKYNLLLHIQRYLD